MPDLKNEVQPQGVEGLLRQGLQEVRDRPDLHRRVRQEQGPREAEARTARRCTPRRAARRRAARRSPSPERGSTPDRDRAEPTHERARDGRRIAAETVGFIDIGTNSVRLMVVRLEPDHSWSTITLQKETVRLGEGEFGGAERAAAGGHGPRGARVPQLRRARARSRRPDGGHGRHLGHARGRATRPPSCAGCARRRASMCTSSRARRRPASSSSGS